ncbi:MAG TPA: 3-phenylpropionate/cinnamic acid dioxygenase subunit beta [Dehalococcoidia bacterium]|nr:3-phenylpropionate/cinnamic acid dioxygenase subunit beta [Dehalococcoidia bacterium]
MDESQSAAVARLLLQREVEEWLFHEAELLDERRFAAWLELLAEDVRYWMPLRRNVRAGEQAAREATREQRDIAWFDEGKETLRKRVQQIETGIHWAEEPLSRLCHLVTNVQILADDGAELRVKSRFLLYRNRLQEETDILVGKREDTLRRVAGGLLLARRAITLDQNVLLAKNLTFFL